MNKKITQYLVGIALAASVISSSAASVSVATVPQGIITYPIASGVVNYLSLPLTKTEAFTGVVSTVSSSTITVGDSPAPFTTSLATSSSPYFVKFLTGNETGRVVRITANTASALTIDTTDHSTGSMVPLDTTGFNVQVGDSFEVFPGDTLASVLGAGTTQNPLMLTGGDTVATADTVSLLTTVNTPAQTYFFNTAHGYWQQYGMSGSANDTIIYPYSALVIARQANHPSTTLVVSGRVTSVTAETKLISGCTILTSTHFATDVKLSQLNFGSNWVTGTTVGTADNIGVWNATTKSFDTYFQRPDSTWRKYPDQSTDQSNFAIAAGTVTAISKRAAVSGGATFLHSPLPYSLD
jgi:uncharacterized protein (TIGR02597 family)